MFDPQELLQEQLPNLRIWPKTLLVHKDAKLSPFTRHIMRRWKHGPIAEIDNPQAVIDQVNASRDPLTEGKRYLLLARWPGKFIKPCQGIIDQFLVVSSMQTFDSVSSNGR